MEYKKIDNGSYKVHMIKTSNFKKNIVKVVFSDKVIKEEITLKNVLTDVLCYSTKKYNSHRKLSIYLDDLYASNIFSGCYRLGNLYNNEFGISFLNEKYTESGMFDKCIKLLSEIILKPFVKDNKFDESTLNIAKESNRVEINSVCENTGKLSLVKMLEIMGKDESFSLHGFGYLEDLNKINTTSLYDYYLKMISSSKIDIFVIGNIDFDYTLKLIKKHFKFNNKPSNNKIIYEHESFSDGIKSALIEYPVSQSKLCIGCKMLDLTDFERNYVLSIYNNILGGSSDSRMFKNIREKNSLCYYINSSANKLDNILFITSGINKNNYKKVIELVSIEMNNISKGLIDKKDIDKAVVNYISALDELEDNENSIISYYYAIELLGLDNIEDRKKKIKQVTKEDIINLSKKIKIDTICLLGGQD